VKPRERSKLLRVDIIGTRSEPSILLLQVSDYVAPTAE
jgi:hypothetical protein